MKTHCRELFSKISPLCGVSGYSYEVSDFLIDELTRIGVQCGRDSMGSVSAFLPSIDTRRKPANRVMFCAHLDNVGYLVYEIEEDNKIILSKVGAPDLIGSSDGFVKTTTGNIGVTIEDTGYDEDPYYAYAYLKNNDNIKDISLGDSVFYDSPAINTPAGKFTGAFMDNRAGLLAMLLAIKEVVKLKNNLDDIFFVFSALEEVGAYGAISAAAKIKPSFAVNLDLFSVNTKRELSAGIVIHRGTIYNTVLTEHLLLVAGEEKIKHRMLVPSPTDESDSAYIIWQNGGTPVCEIGIPGMEVHTPVETVSIKAILDTAKLVYKFCGYSHKVRSLIFGGA